MNIVVVYNEKSGNTPSKQQLEKLFTDNIITVEAMIDIGTSANAVQEHANKGAIIATVGGDGTISSVANMIYKTKAVLAPLPGGTLNHFTKDLGIQQDLKLAVADLLLKQPRKIDVATINDTVFINNSSIGLYPSSVHEREQLQSKYGKWPSAVIASIKAFVRFKHYAVIIDDAEYRTPFVFVGNNSYDLTDVAKRSSFSEGVLCVHMIASNSRLKLLKIIAFILIGSIRESKDLLSFTTSSLTIHAKKSVIRISRDGETIPESTPLTYKIQPRSITILG